MIDSLHDRFKSIFFNKKEILEMVYGQYLKEDTFKERPLSKLTYDILIDLGVDLSDDASN